MKSILLAVFSIFIFSCDNNAGSTKDGPDPAEGSGNTVLPILEDDENDKDTSQFDSISEDDEK